MRDSALTVDDLEPVRPTGVGRFDRILKIIEQGGEIDLEISHAGMGYRTPFLQALGIGNQDLVLHIAVRLPAIGGVSFLDVDHVKGDLFLVLLVELVEFGNLPTKRRSGIAPEKQHHWRLSTE